jgi:hypothetical protein
MPSGTLICLECGSTSVSAPQEAFGQLTVACARCSGVSAPKGPKKDAGGNVIHVRRPGRYSCGEITNGMKGCILEVGHDGAHDSKLPKRKRQSHIGPGNLELFGPGE